MSSFDGTFALDYVYPLAAQAYDGDFYLAFDDPGEIVVDTTSPSFQASFAAIDPVNDNADKMLQSMMAASNSGHPPSAATIAAAEGLGTAAADPDALLPPITLPAAATAPVLPLDKRFGWVCIDTAAKRLIVTFRGTQTAGDWLNNLDFIHAPYRPDPNAGTVHQGFQHVYYAIRDSLLSLVQARLTDVTQILVVGHSLGGALTTLAMPDLLETIAVQSGSPTSLAPTLYNLASPRVGNRDFQHFFNSKSPCWRIVNVWDVVPHVPPALAGFVHVGTQLTIDSGFSFDVARNHVLATGYLPGLTAWNQKHPSHELGEAPIASTLPLTGREVEPGVSD